MQKYLKITRERGDKMPEYATFLHDSICNTLTANACAYLSEFYLKMQGYIDSDNDAEPFEVLPYMLPLRSLVRRLPEGRDDAKISEITQLLATIPTFVETSWEELSLEDLIISIAADIQTDWRMFNCILLTDNAYCSQYRHLPFAFQSWTEAWIYVEIVKNIFTSLGFIIDNHILLMTFYFFAAQEFYQYQLHGVKTLYDIVAKLIRSDSEMSDLLLEERHYFDDTNIILNTLTPQFQQFGFGSPQCIAAFATTFGEAISRNVSSIEISAMLQRFKECG